MKQAKAYLHLGSWAWGTAYPVVVLRRGEKTATVRLLHTTPLINAWRKRGYVAKRVPLSALKDKPCKGFMVSLGRGKVVPERVFARGAR